MSIHNRGELRVFTIRSKLHSLDVVAPTGTGKLLATGDHCEEREKAYAVASQLDWFVRPFSSRPTVLGALYIRLDSLHARDEAVVLLVECM